MSDATKTDALEGIQALRALAALLVVVHHAMEESLFSPVGVDLPDWLITGGAAGVDIFFVISGFIMMAVSFGPARSPDGPWTFLRKRVARIYPLYWVIAAIFLIAWSQGKLLHGRVPEWGDTLRAWLLLPSEHYIVSVSWTLVHEMNFYLLFALTLFLRSALASLLGVSALLLAQLAAAQIAGDGAVVEVLTRAIILEFVLGLALGYAYVKGWLTKPAPAWAVLASLAAMFLAPVFVAHETTGGLPALERVWAWGAPAVVLVLASLHWRFAQSGFRRVTLLLGDASYAIYLAHPLVMIALELTLRAAPDLPGFVDVLLIAAASVGSAALGVVVHRWLEKPLNDAARRLLLPQRARAPNLSAAA